MMGRPSGSERLARVLGGLSGLSSLARTVPARRLVTAAQAAAAAAAAVRLARGRDRLPPLSPPLGGTTASISVVIPARNEEHRIGPCLRAALADPAVREVIVVDDESRDGTARLASALGATVLSGAPLPPGWVGKPWALRQGTAAARGEVVVTLDADARPRPGLFAAVAAALDCYDLVSVGPRFVCDGVAEQALHASFLTTLVYRFGPVGPRLPLPPHRAVANGQCMAFRRDRMAEADGFTRIRGHFADDVALARTLAADGWAVGFLDAGGLLEVDMYESAGEVWREWARTLTLRDETDPVRQAADLAVIWLTCALPAARLALGRPTRLDLALLGARLLVAGALRGSYVRPGPGLWLAPLCDPAAAARLTLATLRPVRAWRGRAYPADVARGVPGDGPAERLHRPAPRVTARPPSSPLRAGGRP